MSGILCFWRGVFDHATSFCTWLETRKRGMLSMPLWLSKSRCSRLSSTRGGRDRASESSLVATHPVSCGASLFLSPRFPFPLVSPPFSSLARALSPSLLLFAKKQEGPQGSCHVSFSSLFLACPRPSCLPSSPLSLCVAKASRLRYFLFCLLRSLALPPLASSACSHHNLPLQWPYLRQSRQGLSWT